MSNLQKLFKLGGHKAPRPPRRDYEDSEDSENDESYLDPTTVHPTTSPMAGPVMPSYPPPRPYNTPHSPASRRVQDPGKRASVPITFGQMNHPPVPRARSNRPQSAEHLQTGKAPIPTQRLGVKVRVSFIFSCFCLWYLPVNNCRGGSYIFISLSLVKSTGILLVYFLHSC